MVESELTLKEIHQSFEDYWRSKAEGNDDIKYSKSKDFETLLMGGKELLTVWYNKVPKGDFKVLGIEEPFSFTLPGLPIPIIGAMDLIEEDEAGTIIITDFKTSGKSYSADDVNKNTQMTIYQLAAKANGFGDREILLRFDCLIKTKTPKFEQYWSTRSEIDERRIIKKIISAWNGISKGVFIPNDTSWRCHNCGYKTACNDWFLEEVAAA